MGKDFNHMLFLRFASSHICHMTLVYMDGWIDIFNLLCQSTTVIYSLLTFTIY